VDGGTQRAIKHLGNGYGLVADLVKRSNKATINARQGAAILQVNVVSTWMNRFNQARQDLTKLAMRGKSKKEAIALLLCMPRVQTASISIKNTNAFPTDIQRIQLNFVLLA
jgi:hypothetical protein